MIVVEILVWLLVIVGALVALVLVMPLSFRAEGALEDDEEIGWHVRIAWGFGLVAVHLMPGDNTLRLCGLRIRRLALGADEDDDATRRRKADKRVRRAERRRKRRASKAELEEPGRRRGVLWFFQNRSVLFAIVRRYLGALHLSGEVEGVVGLPSPEHNATLHQLLALADSRLPAGLIAVEVDWVEEVFALRAKVGGWIWPLQLAAITAWLFIDRKSWRAITAT